MGVRSEQLLREQAALLAEIDAAFGDVNRDGGVSWSEARVIDDYGYEYQRREARERDKDRHWSELVADESWDPGVGVGGWCFLDPIGFRYYLPAAMKRSLPEDGNRGVQPWLMYWGDKSDEHKVHLHSLLNQRQRQCVIRFIRFMIEVSRQPQWEDDDADGWEPMLKRGWLPQESEEA